ncbi:unnamed protein product, partial [Meganyctiphanes norvegica]
FIIWIVQQISSKISGDKPETLNNSIFMSMGIMLEDVPPKQPKDMPTQILIGFWLIVTFLIATTYRAQLLGILAVPAMSPSMDSLDKLADYRDTWTWGMQWYDSSYEWFKRGQSETLRM